MNSLSDHRKEQVENCSLCREEEEVAREQEAASQVGRDQGEGGGGERKVGIRLLLLPRLPRLISTIAPTRANLTCISFPAHLRSHRSRILLH